MRIKNTYKVITNEGNTSDIIDVVMMAYDIENDDQIAHLAKKLQGSTERETCRNIWSHLITNVRYVADVGTQQIKSPARLLHDGTGDCKSYSIFTACILRDLGIEHFFRFASYSRHKEATHVYVVAVIDNKHIPIDAVAYVQARKEFGTEIKYNYRVDMSSRTTKIAYLAGIKAAKMGATDADVQAFLNSEAFKVWLDGEDENELTAAKGYLLSEWDKWWTVFIYETSEAEKLNALNALQYVGAMIRFFNEYGNDNEMLEKAGHAFSNLIAEGAFDTNESEPNRRNFFSDYEQKRVLQYIDNGKLGSQQFTDNWKTNILDANIQYHVSGIGNVNELRDNLKKTGGYYLYTYIPESDVKKYNVGVYRKRLVQKQLLEMNKDLMVKAKKMTAAEVDNLIYAGCLTTWGNKPQNAISHMSQPKIGEPMTAAALYMILKIIAVSISILISIVGLVGAIMSISKKTVEQNAPSDDDFDDNKLGGQKGGEGKKKPDEDPDDKKAGSSFLLPLLLGGGLLISKLKN